MRSVLGKTGYFRREKGYSLNDKSCTGKNRCGLTFSSSLLTSFPSSKFTSARPAAAERNAKLPNLRMNRFSREEYSALASRLEYLEPWIPRFRGASVDVARKAPVCRYPTNIDLYICYRHRGIPQRQGGIFLDSLRMLLGTNSEFL